MILKKSGFKNRAICSSFLTVVLGASAIDAPGQSLVQEELDRRRDSVIAAEEAIMAGDKAYQESAFNEAVDFYREAFAKIPAGDRTNKFRDAAKERYAQAAVQAARVMNRQGDRDGAIALVDEVLGEAVFPDYFPAQKLRAQLDDPIRTNPAATKEHGRKVDEVRRLLYQAEGFYNLADFDRSMEKYQEVLRIDPYNKAARRGLERNNGRISDYANAARDHTRAEMLAQVSGAWELDPGKEVIAFGNGNVGQEIEFQGVRIENKLDDIFIPFVDFDGASLEEAIEFLEGQSRALDPELVEENKGLDFVLNMGAGDSPVVQEIRERRFSLRLRNVPLREVVEQVTRQSGASYRVDNFAVLIEPAGGLTDDLIVRRYKVPPSFLSQTSSTGSAGDLDPFSSGDDSKAKLAPRLTARQYLEEVGVPFPDGSSASYNPGLGELLAKTSSSAHEDIRRIVEAINLKEPVAVVVETKIVRISQSNLDELNFDVALQNLAASGDLIFDGGTVGNGRATDFTGGQQVTAGLRSGDFATGGDPFTDVLERVAREVPSSSTTLSGTTTVIPENPPQGVDSAPGFLSLIGTVNDTGYSALLRGLDQKEGTDVMSQPSVITRSGQQALLESARDFIYPTEYEPPEIPNSIGTTTLTDVTAGESFSPTSFIASPSHPTAFETRKLGTILEVQPTVSGDRSYVDLAFNLRMDEFLGFVNYGEPIQGGSTQAAFGLIGIDVTAQTGEVTSNEILMPFFDSVRLNTNVSVATGETIIIGGVVNERVENVEDKVPVLGSLPFLGKLFTSNALQREKKVVMVFVTVRIVDPAGNPVQN